MNDDPRALRALAHPVRLAILDYLHTAGPATATECAEVVGESPSSCSYHLRTLARWGFVEEVAGEDRRERRWRRLARRVSWSSDEAATPDEFAAGRELLDATLAREDRTVATYLANEERVDPAWRSAANFIANTLYMTPAEVTELREQVERLFEPYIRGGSEPRPKGAASVRVIFRSVPFGPPLRAAPPEAPRGGVEPT